MVYVNEKQSKVKGGSMTKLGRSVGKVKLVKGQSKLGPWLGPTVRSKVEGKKSISNWLKSVLSRNYCTVLSPE